MAGMSGHDAPSNSAPSGHEDLRTLVRRARSQFSAMAGTYFLGVFNDSLYKQAVLLLVPALQGYVIVLFTLPFILLAAPAGFLADRFPKRNVVIASKVLELLAMLAGAAGIVLGNLPLIFLMTVVMATQSTIFSPALNGSIPELYPSAYVTRANALLKAATTAAILVGTAVAGFALDVGQGQGSLSGRWAVAASVVLVAVLGVLASLGVPRRPAGNPRVTFPWRGPLDTLAVLWEARRDPLLATILMADGFIWFVASLQLTLINILGRQQLGASPTVTSCLVVAELVGVAGGGLLAGRIAVGRRWHRVLVPAGAVLAAALLAVGLTPFLPAGAMVPAVAGLLAVAGAAGGVMLVPCESFFQVHARPEQRGQILAAANFAAFAGILLSGPAFQLLEFLVRPTTAFAVSGLVVAVGVWAIGFLLRRWVKG